MRRKLQSDPKVSAALLLAAALFVPACGGGPGSGSGDPPDPLAVSAASADASISADGTLIAFASTSMNLVPPASASPGAGGNPQIFIFHRAFGTVTALAPTASSGGSISISSSAISSNPSMSGNGRFVVFQSNESLTAPASTSGAPSAGSPPVITNIFRTDLLSGQTQVVSVASDGSTANGASSAPSASADGSRIAFQSSATNLVPGAPGVPAGTQQILVKDMNTGQVTRVSVASSGAPANADGLNPSISADGTAVAFDSTATNLGTTVMVPGVSNVFIHTLSTGQTLLVTRGLEGAGGNAGSSAPSMSSDGQRVAFQSNASDLTTPSMTGLAGRNVFVGNVSTGVITLVSVAALGKVTPTSPANGSSQHASISADGRFVAFDSSSTDLTADTNLESGFNVFVRDLQAGTTKLASRALGTSVVPITTAASQGGMMGSTRVTSMNSSNSQKPSISADGRFVAFESDSPRLSTAATNQATNIIVTDVASDLIRLASPEITATTGTPTITAPTTGFTPVSPGVTTGPTGVTTVTPGLTIGGTTNLTGVTTGDAVIIQ